jgi:Na+/H+ antiporter NhaC
MVALLIGQIAEQTSSPYTWLPWAIVAWLVAVTLGALWLGKARPETLRLAGAVLAEDATVTPAMAA